MSFVYLLHFHQPISPRHTAQHYLGYADDLDERIWAQRQGKGSRFCQVAAERRIQFVVAEVWRGDRRLERSLKNCKNARQLCPICTRQCAPPGVAPRP